MGGNALRTENNIERAVKFLDDAARYFENRPTNGEDRAYWANVYNAENCRDIIKILLDKEQEIVYNTPVKKRKVL